MNSTFSPSSRAALEHKKSLGQRKIVHNAHASTKGAGAFYAIADNAAVWTPALRGFKFYYVRLYAFLRYGYEKSETGINSKVSVM